MPIILQASLIDASNAETVVASSNDEEPKVSGGVRLVWVHWNYRRKGVATALLDALRRNLVYGYTIPKVEIAFSSPTTSGRALAARYLGESEFLFYQAAPQQEVCGRAK